MFGSKPKKRKNSLANRVKRLETKVAKKEKIAKLKAKEQSLRAKLSKL